MGAKRTIKPAASNKKAVKSNKSTGKNAGTESPKKNNKNAKEESSPSGTGSSKMTLSTAPIITSRQAKRPGRPPSGKRLAMSRELSGKVRSAYKRSLDPCDNSNDSGLGFEHHVDPHQQTVSLSEKVTWSGERAEAKRQRLDIKLENDDINEGYCFPETMRTCTDNISLIRTAPAGSVPHLSMNNNGGSSSGRAVPRCLPLSSRQSSSAPVALTTQLSATSRYIDVTLMIIKQPEQQHRARYQTEGSRGAVKDREGNGFPIVQLTGYYKPATLQVFIGTDVGKVAPHMFYQACKVSGKNSTPCVEKKVDGTCVIELQLDPSKEMSATCDCVGILKERNVDVEHRFPDQLGNRSKKKSTKCRMIFRTTITLEDGSQETLQVCSQPIVCTQPPGVPEICKKSLTSCPASGGLELFVLGKNFLKDTKVFFQQFEDGRVRWEQSVVPDKEYLQQTHFVCVVPQYRRPDITEPISVRLCVMSSGKTSETHQFVYTPINGAMPSVHIDGPSPVPQPQPTAGPFFKGMLWQQPVSKREQDLDMMPPPDTSMVPMSTRRSSISVPSTSEVHSPPLRTLKQEYIDENSQNSLIDPIEIRQERYRHVSESSMDVHHGDSNMSMINENSMDMMQQHNSMMNHLNENSNLSMSNDDSVEMVRRNSFSRPVSSACENSMDLNMSNSNISTANEDSSCSTVMHCSNPVMTDRLVLPQSVMHQGLPARELSPTVVMDLRMKMPMATVADLVSTNAPSLAALQRFGMMDTPSAPLPTQSAQSIENYLTKIETNKNILSMGNMPLKSSVEEMLTSESALAQKILTAAQVMNNQSCGILPTTTQSLSHLGAASTITEANAVYMNSQRQFLSNTSQNEAINIVAKSEAAAIGEQTLPEQTNAMASSAITTIASALERSIPTPINTERLDDFVNSTVESHIGSPPRSDSSTKNMMVSVSTNPPPEVIITSQDVMLNSQNALMVPPIINTRMPSPVLQTEMTHSSNLSPEVILNSQISPSLMCRNSTSLPSDSLLPTANICQSASTVETNVLPPVNQQNLLTPITAQNSPDSIASIHSPIGVTLNHESEKQVLLEAAVDFFETQKKINNMGSPPKPVANDIISMGTSSTSPMLPNTSNLSQLSNNTGNNFVQFTSTAANLSNNMIMSKSVVVPDNKADFVIPIPVKEIAASVQTDKKNEDRMIPQSFTSLTENELINLINPSCFDQGNNNSYQ